MGQKHFSIFFFASTFATNTQEIAENTASFPSVVPSVVPTVSVSTNDFTFPSSTSTLQTVVFFHAFLTGPCTGDPDRSTCGKQDINHSAACGWADNPCPIWSRFGLSNEQCGYIYKFTHATSGIEVIVQVVSTAHTSEQISFLDSLNNPYDDEHIFFQGILLSTRAIEQLCPVLCKSYEMDNAFCPPPDTNCPDNFFEIRDTTCGCSCWDLYFFNSYPHAVAPEGGLINSPCSEACKKQWCEHCIDVGRAFEIVAANSLANSVYVEYLGFRPLECKYKFS
eukprot:GHVP01053700.1.p1 GENE.GHVP01053700.1~~GHVP01053700.1.p1  ORF type:complete len:280 (+),score=26.75 GHVP01053700.1:1424-2263(+)